MKKRYLNRVLFVALAFASQMLGSACASQNSAQLQENALLAAAQKAAGKDNSMDIQALEPNALAATDANAERQGRRLILHLKSGTEKPYENRPECNISDKESKCQMYVLVAHASSRSTFVVAKLFYESIEYLLVDDVTGEETILRSFPYYSPSGNHILVLLVNDEQVGFAVQIWSRVDHKFILDWSGSPHTEGMYTSYELVRWPSENTIELQAKISFAPPKPSMTKRFELRYAAHRWDIFETH
jgi:hypothetical protein